MEVDKNIKRVFRCMWLKLEEESEHDGTWRIMQSDELNATFKHPESVMCSMKGMIGAWPCNHMSADDIANIVLHAECFWWIVFHGTVMVSNPFLGCSSVDEAVVKADLDYAAKALREDARLSYMTTSAVIYDN